MECQCHRDAGTHTHTHAHTVNRCAAAHAASSLRSRDVTASSGANNSRRVRRAAPRASVSERQLADMVDAADVDVQRPVRRHHPAASHAGRPPSSSAAVSAAPAGAAAYSLDRKLVRRELLTWAKKIPVVVGTSRTTNAGTHDPCSRAVRTGRKRA